MHIRNAWLKVAAVALFAAACDETVPSMSGEARKPADGQPRLSGPRNLPLYPNGAAAAVRAEARRAVSNPDFDDGDRTCAGVWSTVKPDEMTAEYVLAGTTIAVHGGRLVLDDVEQGKLFLRYKLPDSSEHNPPYFDWG
jgi:hypothetical protein